MRMFFNRKPDQPENAVHHSRGFERLGVLEREDTQRFLPGVERSR